MYNSHSIKTVVLIVHAGVQVRLKNFSLDKKKPFFHSQDFSDG